MHQLSRRQFLRDLGVGAAAATLAACSGTAQRRGFPPTATPPGPGVTPPAATPASPGPPDWAALRSRLHGTLTLTGDPGYAAAARGYNPLFDAHQPAAVAACASPSDVQACLATASGARMPVAARSGGHSYAGYSAPPGGLVVDLAPMAAVDVHADGTATVGAGARLIDVYGALAAAGRCLPGGSCPTVGIAGLTLGGGVGVLARQYGLTADRLVSATVVTPDGAVRTASAASEPDLFWALRGGGGGNGGIVTSFSFSTLPAPQLAVFAARYPAGSAAAVLAGWLAWIEQAPATLWSNCILSAGSPPTVRINGTSTDSTSALTSALADLNRRTGTAPTQQSVTSKSYLQAMLYFAGCSQLATCHLAGSGAGTLVRETFVASSRVMATAPADPGAVVALLAGRSGIDLIVDALGGAVAQVAPGDTAFPHRRAVATMQIYAGTTAAAAQSTRQAVGAVRDGLAPLVGSGAYVNYIDPELGGWQEAYYGDNLARLQSVVRRYDPDGVLRFAQGLAPGA
ncbi:MAG TPA: FAD-binding oxidoreductase [Actinomycetota bacterium]|nr:FAD-binding oxidoreductase [Actinomycetota bacterium]